jgi:hypothetical protein
VAWIPAVYLTWDHHNSRPLTPMIAIIFGCIAIAATIALGASLGYRRQWGYLGWSLVLGMIVIGLVVFFAFENSVPSNAPNDPGVGLGAMFATALLAPVVALFLWVGGAVGLLLRRVRS